MAYTLNSVCSWVLFDHHSVLKTPILYSLKGIHTLKVATSLPLTVF